MLLMNILLLLLVARLTHSLALSIENNGKTFSAQVGDAEMCNRSVSIKLLLAVARALFTNNRILRVAQEVE